MAKTKPQTQQQSTIKDWQEADTNLKAIGNIDQAIKKLESEMNLKITAIQEKYQPDIDKYNEEKIGLERNLQLFCEEKRDEFDDKKSKELSFGIVSFRNSTPALKTLKGYTWEAVKNVVSKTKKYAAKFIKTKTDLNKQAILNAGLKESELAKIGCVVTQEENFYYEYFERK